MAPSKKPSPKKAKTEEAPAVSGPPAHIDSIDCWCNPRLINLPIGGGQYADSLMHRRKPKK